MTEHQLIASDGLSGDLFGDQTAADGVLLLVGAPLAGPLGLYSGAAYVFEELAGTWKETWPRSGTRPAARPLT